MVSTSRSHRQTATCTTLSAHDHHCPWSGLLIGCLYCHFSSPHSWADWWCMRVICSYVFLAQPIYTCKKYVILERHGGFVQSCNDTSHDYHIICSCMLERGLRFAVYTMHMPGRGLSYIVMETCLQTWSIYMWDYKACMMGGGGWGWGMGAVSACMQVSGPEVWKWGWVLSVVLWWCQAAPGVHGWHSGNCVA